MTYSTLDCVTDKAPQVRPDANPDELFDYIDISSVNNTKKRIERPQRLLGRDAPSRARKSVRAGDVLVSMTRPNLNAVALVDDRYDGAVASTGFAVLRPGSELLPEFLFHFVQTPAFVSRLATLTAGQMYPAVSERDIRNAPLHMPPLDEQRRIVDLLSRAAGLKRLAQEAQAKARELIPALFVDMFGTEQKNRWPMASFGSLVRETQLGLVRGARETGDDRRFPYVRMNSITLQGELDLEELKRVDATAAEVERYRLEPGDFLFNTRNSRELVGKVAVFEAAGTYLFNNNILRVRFKRDLVAPTYVTAAFATAAVQRELELRKSGTTTVFAIYYKNLATLPLPLPPIELQEEFADRTSEVGSLLRLANHASLAAERTSAALMSRLFAD